ncbi:hypothetical protein C4546_04155 [Candidatus Parcubacteria bacterium]|jgi:hypothetical protein|nr:MAG: hypothetical protein C4546_04155 [Candidatus Parcubacteria bacterium]
MKIKTKNYFLLVSKISSLAALVGGLFFLYGVFVWDAVSAPVQVSTCSNYSCTLTIPRYRLFMSQNDPNDLWLAFPNSRYNDFKKSNDGGLTWNATEPDALTVKGYMDFHASISGDSQDNLYLTDPGPSAGIVWFRKIRAPGETATDLNSPITLTSSFIPANIWTRSNILAQDSNNIWIFYRTSNSPVGNVRYFRSTNGGASFDQEGWVAQLNIEDVRVGSFMIGNQPAVVIHYISATPGQNLDYRYFIWNGSAFVPNDDSIAVSNEATGAEREFSMTYVNGELHLVYNNRTKLRHAWKTYNNGQGTWQHADIEVLPYDPLDWHASLSKHGNDLYLFYVRQESSTGNNNNIYYRKWNKDTQAWSDRIALTSDGICNRFPQGPAVVNAQADFIPMVWTASVNCASPFTIMSQRISVSPGAPENLPPTGDTTPPAAVTDLLAN